MTSNRKQFTVICEMLTAVTRHLSIKRLFIFHQLDPFVGHSNNPRLCLGKQNSLFPLGPCSVVLADSNSALLQLLFVGMWKRPIIYLHTSHNKTMILVMFAVVNALTCSQLLFGTYCTTETFNTRNKPLTVGTGSDFEASSCRSWNQNEICGALTQSFLISTGNNSQSSDIL